MRRKVLVPLFSAALVVSLFLSGCAVAHGDSNLDNPNFDVTAPVLINAGNSPDTANESGWYNVFIDEFDGDTLNDRWTYSAHTVRWESKKAIRTSYWCPDMVTVSNGCVEIRSKETKNHVCSYGICPSVGRFTGGIETRVPAVNADGSIGSDAMLFEQAFGYFEARVKFPNEKGLWSAFWLQSQYQGKIGNDGEDGTEIDVYESAFINNPDHMGNALLWDGYSKYGKVADYIGDYSDKFGNLYDDFHSFGLKWTPDYYVFYIDRIPVWATNAGGVSKVPEFLRLTIEIDAGDGFGPHGQRIGKFKDKGSVFYIDSVSVYQNVNYIPEIKSNDYYVSAI